MQDYSELVAHLALWHGDIAVVYTVAFGLSAGSVFFGPAARWIQVQQKSTACRLTSIMAPTLPPTAEHLARGSVTVATTESLPQPFPSVRARPERRRSQASGVETTWSRPSLLCR